MANELTESERMTRQETKLETIEAVLMRLEAKVDTWQANFVSKELLEEKLKARDKEIERINNELEQLEERLEHEKNTHKSTLPLWVGAFFTGINLIILLWPKK